MFDSNISVGGSNAGSIASNNLVSVVSYNLHGFNQGSTLLKDLCTNVEPDVIFLQEHWLSSINLDKIKFFARNNYYCVASSAMETVIQSGILRGRPFGGLAIMVKNNMAKNSNAGSDSIPSMARQDSETNILPHTPALCPATIIFSA